MKGRKDEKILQYSFFDKLENWTLIVAGRKIVWHDWSCFNSLIPKRGWNFTTTLTVTKRHSKNSSMGYS